MATSKKQITDEKITEISLDQMKLFEFHNQVWWVSSNVNKAHLERPETWARVAPKVRAGDIVHLFGNGFYAQLTVIYAEPGISPIITAIFIKDLPKIIISDGLHLPEHYFIHFDSDQHAYRGGREIPGVDDEVKWLTAFHSSKSEAYSELMRHQSLK